MNEDQFSKSMQTIKNYIDANSTGEDNSAELSQLTSRVGNLETSKADKNEIPTSLPANGGNADTLDNLHLLVVTQSQYDSIASKDPNTIYLIIE